MSLLKGSERNQLGKAVYVNDHVYDQTSTTNVNDHVNVNDYVNDHVNVNDYVNDHVETKVAQERAPPVRYLGEPKMLSYKRLDVYQCAIKFLAVVAKILSKLPRGYSFLADELKRASTSMPQNIAEGAGKPTEPDKCRYLGIARGSAMECGAILDACAVLKLADTATLEEGDDLLERIVSMLTKMIG